MPRPYVEVHQRVLDPVITVNDPQQRVCLVGLHTEEVSNPNVYTHNLISSLDAGDEIPVTTSTDIEFTVDVDGVLVNSDIAIGDDVSTIIEGDLQVTLVSPQINLVQLTGTTRVTSGSNHTPAGQYAVATGAVTAEHLQLDDLKLVVNPAAGFTSCLQVDVGVAGLNFLDGSYPGAPAPITALADLQVGSTVTLKLSGVSLSGVSLSGVSLSGVSHGTFVVRAKTQDKIFLGSTTVAQHAKLKQGGALSSATGITLTIGTTDIAGFTFKLVSAGAAEVSVDALSSTSAALVLSSNLPFDLVAAGDATAALTCKSDDVIISELDVPNPLEVTTTASGDADVVIPRETLTTDLGLVIKCSVAMAYTVAKNTYSAGLQSVTVNNLSTLLGKPSPRNPLAMAAELALLNAPATQVNVLALDITPGDSDEFHKPIKQAFLEALSVLERSRDVYAMVPLSTDSSITLAYARSAEAMSVPKRGKFRICLGSSTGAPTADYIVGSSTSLSTTGIVANGTLSDEAVNFKAPTSRVLVGDTVYVEDSAQAVHIGTVDEVIPGGLVVDWSADPAPAGSVSYRVYRSLRLPSKTARQIELLKLQAVPLSSKRLFLTFPGRCTVSSAGAGVEFGNQPSFYITAAFSGLMAATDIHRPKNFIGVSGVKLADIARFSDDELDAISDAGYLVFQQTAADALPFCVHQVNTFHGTNPGTQEFTELSVISNYDFVSAYFKSILDPFAGTVNIVPEVLATIRGSLQAGITNLTARKVVGIGAPIISGAVDTVRQASYDSGAVEASVSVRLPKVLNKLILEVVSA